MAHPRFTGLDRKRLRIVLGLFVLALAVPTTVLVVHAYGQLKWEAFHQTRSVAEALVARIDERLLRLVSDEDRHSFTDFEFLVVSGTDTANFVQPSKLSEFPVNSAIPGLLGYFQVDAESRFSTPLLPTNPTLADDFGINEAQRRQRAALEDRLLAILTDNLLIQERTTARLDSVKQVPDALKDVLRDFSSTVGQATEADDVYRVTADEELVEGENFATKSESRASEEDKVAKNVDLVSPYSSEAPARAPMPQARQLKEQISKRKTRRERSQQPAPVDVPVAELAAGAREKSVERRITTFESELDPFELSRLNSGHLVLHRTAWRDAKRYTQGAIIDYDQFLEGTVAQEFYRSTISSLGEVTAAWRGEVTKVFPQRSASRGMAVLDASLTPSTGTLLYRTRMSAPASQLELLFGVTRMPAGPGARVLTAAAGVMALVLAGGVFIMYRLGLREIALVQQQQDFVAAVSHELRTPLTSIRMYGEMLREGWASEEKKRSYYDFIFNESERLSRLISNVLQLAHMTRSDSALELKTHSVAELMDGVRSKVVAQIESAGFELDCDLPPKLDAQLGQQELCVNVDAFSQIAINLVDNAIKFSGKSERKRVEIRCIARDAQRRVVFSVRDYGPGVRRDQIKKIFKLFYRSENELTRETVGTGIGLALVSRLAQLMHAEVDVRNADPGAEFSVTFPVVDTQR